MLIASVLLLACLLAMLKLHRTKLRNEARASVTGWPQLSDHHNLRHGLIYTCNCGWIDLGHARPDGARALWMDMLEEKTASKDGSGYKISYSQSMAFMNTELGRRTGVYYVKSGLSRTEKEAVALAVFMEVSYSFERLQDNMFWSTVSNSGFSSGDLVSNLIGFYKAVNPGVDYLMLAKPVSEQTALSIWDKYGEVNANKNIYFQPLIFPFKECGVVDAPVINPLPAWLSTIVPAKKGELFRDWTDSDE